MKGGLRLHDYKFANIHVSRIAYVKKTLGHTRN